MLTILGRSSRRNEFCDGGSRRDFLKIGGLTMGGLTLPQLLRAAHRCDYPAGRWSCSVFRKAPGRPRARCPRGACISPSEVA